MVVLKAGTHKADNRRPGTLEMAETPVFLVSFWCVRKNYYFLPIQYVEFSFDFADFVRFVGEKDCSHCAVQSSKLVYKKRD